MPVVVVEPDATALSNLLVDSGLLWMAVRWAGGRPRRSRVVAGAAVGALYAVAAGLGGFSLPWLLGWEVKLAVAVLMAVAACGWPGRPPAVRVAAWLVAGSFVLAGVALGAQSLLAAPGAAPLSPLVAGAGAFVLLVIVTWRYAGKAPLAEGRAVHPVAIRVGEVSARVLALLDTGNSLVDPLSRLPVLVCEATALAGLLPSCLAQAVAQDAPAAVTDGLPEDWRHRLRIIPFRSLGQERGVMLGFRPDAVEWACGEVAATAMVVGLSAGKLGSGGDYQALLPAGCLRGAGEAALSRGA